MGISSRETVLGYVSHQKTCRWASLCAVGGQVLKKKLWNCQRVVFWWQNPGRDFENTFHSVVPTCSCRWKKTGNTKLYQKDFFGGKKKAIMETKQKTILFEFPRSLFKAGMPDFRKDTGAGTTNVMVPRKCRHCCWNGSSKRTGPCLSAFLIKILGILVSGKKTGRCYWNLWNHKLKGRGTWSVHQIPGSRNVVRLPLLLLRFSVSVMRAGAYLSCSPQIS